MLDPQGREIALGKQIEMSNDAGQPTCVSRLTMAILAASA